MSFPKNSPPKIIEQFSLKKGQAYSERENGNSEFISAEMGHLIPWFRKIGRRLKYEGEIKMLHRDDDGILACRVIGRQRGEGVRITMEKGPQATTTDQNVKHSVLLASL